jgi:hypothetical protein
MLNTLVVGASGATGRLLVSQLLQRGQGVRVIVRSPASLPAELSNHEKLLIIEASILELSDAELAKHLNGCQAVASCLGHKLSLGGIYGQPRRLVTDAVRRLCQVTQATAPEEKVKFILMNTTGNSNRDLHEQISFGQKLVMGLLRLILPPHVDNEQAADYLRTKIGQNDASIEWAVVRPDGLLDENDVTDYDIHPSPIRSAIFDSGTTSRINVAHFMAALIEDDAVWAKWKGHMPVIYNRAEPNNGV